MANKYPPRRPGETDFQWRQRVGKNRNTKASRGARAVDRAIGGLPLVQGVKKAAGAAVDAVGDIRDYRLHGDKKKTAPPKRTPPGSSADRLPSQKNKGPGQQPLSAKEKQRMLVKYGYLIQGGIDGKWGDSSAAAWRNYQSARKNGLDVDDARSYWNNHSKWAARRDPSNPGTTDVHDRHGPSGGGGAGGGAGGGGGEQANTNNFMRFIQSMMGGSNGGDYSGADAATNVEYDATIAELEEQIKNQETAASRAQVNITNWFDDLLRQERGWAQEDDAALQKSLGDHSGLMSNILGSLSDEGARYGVGKTAMYNEGMLKGIGLAESNYNRNMMGAETLMGRDARESRRIEDKDTMNDLLTDLLSLKKEKGQKKVVNRQDYADRAFKQKAAQFDMAAAMALLPGQIEGQGLDLLLKQLGLLQGEADVAETWAGINGSGTVTAPGSSDRSRVLKEIWSQLVWPDSKTITNDDGTKTNIGGQWRIPRRVKKDGKLRFPVVERINAMLRERGIDPNSPEGIQIRGGLLKRGGIKVGPRGNPAQ